MQILQQRSLKYKRPFEILHQENHIKRVQKRNQNINVNLNRINQHKINYELLHGSRFILHQ